MLADPARAKDFYESYFANKRQDAAIREAQWRIVERSLIGRRGLVLELGCGDGSVSVRLASMGLRVVASDFAVAPLRAVRESVRHEDLGLSLVNADAQQLPVPDASFDAVVCLEVLEHVPSPERVIDEVRRILRPGGLALLSVPNLVSPAEMLHQLKHLVFYILKKEPLTHISPFHYLRVRRLTRGFRQREVHGLHFLTAFLPRADGSTWLGKGVNLLHDLDLVLGRMLPLLAFDYLVVATKGES